MKTPVLVVIKPEGMERNLVGNIINRFLEAKLELVAIRTLRVSKKLAEIHYHHIKGNRFYKSVIDHIMGKLHNNARAVAMVFRGEDSIRKCRKICGATNPEDADPSSVRGAFGRVTTKGVFENIIHVSASKSDAKKEIQLWFQPDEIDVQLFPTKTTTAQSVKQRVWA